jgi:hypothetical protein
LRATGTGSLSLSALQIGGLRCIGDLLCMDETSAPSMIIAASTQSGHPRG